MRLGWAVPGMQLQAYNVVRWEEVAHHKEIRETGPIRAEEEKDDDCMFG